MRFATRAIHAGQEPDPSTGAVNVPLHLSSTFAQDGIGRDRGWEYGRTGNPTRSALETCLASLEGGAYCCAFASGLAAETAVLSLLAPGDRVVAAQDLYGGTVRLFDRVFGPLGIAFTYVDGRDADAFARAIDARTRLVWVETPGNPLLRLTDIRAVAEVSHERGALLAVDNTFASPCLQRPLPLGADIVVHSTTKYIGGHSDVVGGAVVTDDERLHGRIAFLQNAQGAVPGAFDCWLTLRGVKTLAVRMRQHCANAAEVARLLEGHAAVAEVLYPGLESHPQHELAMRQMDAAGGMVSFRVAGGRPAVDRLLGSLRVFTLAESLGGVESLVCYPATMTHAALSETDRIERGITEDLLRLSVGIEDVADLLEDLDGALRR